MPRAKMLFIAIISLILGLITFFSIKTYFITVPLTNDKESYIQNEVNERVESLKADSSERSKVIAFLDGLNQKLANIYTDLNSKQKEFSAAFKLVASSTDQILKYDIRLPGKDSIYAYPVAIYIENAISNALTNLDTRFSAYNQNSTLQTGRLEPILIPQSDYFEDVKKNSIEDRKNHYTTELAMKFRSAFFQGQWQQVRNNQGRLSRDDVDRLIKTFDEHYFSSSLHVWIEGISEVNEEVKAEAGELKTAQAEVKHTIDEISLEMDNIHKLGNDKVLMTIALPVFAILIILLFAIPYLYKDISIPGGDPESNTILVEIFSKGLLLKIFTVFLLTISIVLLAIGDKIKGETIGTLLGGISVYILQNSFGGKQNEGHEGPDARDGK